MNAPNQQQATIQFGITRKSLEATVIHACPHCEGPGIFKNDARTLELWPGCWSKEQANRPVGAFCPNCGKRRTRDKPLGELTSSMPRWIWRCILGVKWCVIQTVALKRRWRTT